METHSSTDTASKPGNGKGRRAPKTTLRLRARPPMPSADELNEFIATAAYFYAERRHFEPGHELDDWLAAERDIKARLFG